MTIFLFLFGVFLSLGIFFVLADVLKLPTIATGKAIINASNRGKQKASGIDVALGNLSLKLSKILTINEYKRIRLQNTLSAAGISKTPEEYMATCIVKAMLMGVFVIPCLLVVPMAAPVLLVLAIFTYFKELGSADKLLAQKRESIESQLPRFVATITQELKNSRDVLKILENFKHSANETFAKELDILTADMRSSSYETALTRFEARINSPMLSDIVRGLISVLRGDDGAVYFQMLAHDMKQMELQNLKMQAMKIPPKIRKFSFIMLMCFLMTYIVIIIFEIISSLGTLF
ncbi:secretion protein F [Chakrabartyella piscis]|uniref:secretion protein F n=1 Tax=Chakrabartyella piscis TaxID=2918914 RepID=UPI002958AD7C|nr:secretion protein F [Chakrabartyella piscis]